MIKKIIITFFVLTTILSAADEIFVFSNEDINSLKITLEKEDTGFYRENFKTKLSFWGYIPWRDEKILPSRYDDQVNLINIGKIYKPSTMNIDSITFRIKLENTDLYGRDFYKVNVKKDDKIKCIIHEGNLRHNGFIEVASVDPKSFSINGTLKVISVNMVLDILKEYVSEQDECWSIRGNSVESEFFESISEDNLPSEDFATIKLKDWKKIDPKKLKFQAMSKGMDQMQDIKFIQKDDNTFLVPNLNFYNLNCWYNNKKQNITELFTMTEYLDRTLTFNYVFNGKEGSYVKPAGKTSIYLPYPSRKIESISCNIADATKAVTLKDGHALSLDEPIAIVIDLNSTRTTNKKNKFDYVDFVKRIYKESENSSVMLFKLFYVYPREATFQKFDINKVYTKFKGTEYSTVEQSESAEFVKWRQDKEKKSIDPMSIPDEYFCMEAIDDGKFFERGLSSTLVKENMADRKYVHNFEYILKRVVDESGYKFKKVYYVSYFPVLSIYKVEGINYISFLEDNKKFKISDITN